MKALQENIDLSPMKLQKLIYFTYRDYLQRTNNKLFYEPICAWKYGPVVEVVYNHFRPFGANSINRFYKDSSDDVHILKETSNPFSNIFNSLWRQYRHLSGIELSRITHKVGTAWYIAWTKSEPFLADEDIRNEPIN
jgi:uncharacterized phage-associated protein